MNIEPTVPTTKNPPAQFAGDVWLDPIALPHEPGQYLHVTQGVGRFGTRDMVRTRRRPPRGPSTSPTRSTTAASSSRFKQLEFPCRVPGSVLGLFQRFREIFMTSRAVARSSV